MDALSETRRGGEADVAARLADTATPRKIYFGPKRSASPKSTGYICIYIYIFSNGDEIEKSRKEWIHLGPRARNLFIRISLPRPIKGCVFEIVIRRFSPKSPGTCKSFRACERKEIAGTTDIPVSRILLERGGKGKRRSSNSKNRESLEMIKPNKPNGASFLRLAFHLQFSPAVNEALLTNPVTRVAPFPILCSTTFKLEIP